MPELKIITQGEQIINLAEEQLAAMVKAAEKAIFEELLLLFEQTDITDGKLASNQKTENFLAKLDSSILSVLKKSGYNEAINKYLVNFDKLSQNIKELHSQMNGINITSAQIDPFKRIEIANTIDKLTGSGLNKDFVLPVRQALYRNVLFGSSVTATEKSIKDFVLSSDGAESKLLRYVKQASRDAISQFEGSVQQGIGDELNLNAKRYVGSLIVDSRAQCVHWVEKGLLLNETLVGEIAIALEKGKLSGRKCQGMNEATDIKTFDIYRGGYNCRHRSIPTKYYKK